MKRTGKVIIQTRDESKVGESDVIKNDRDLKAIIEAEQYCNDHVATEVFRKFGIFLRFHF